MSRGNLSCRREGRDTSSPYPRPSPGSALPIVAPVLDHRGEEVAVSVGPARVGLALVPDRAADGVGHERKQHAKNNNLVCYISRIFMLIIYFKFKIFHISPVF